MNTEYDISSFSRNLRTLYDIYIDDETNPIRSYAGIHRAIAEYAEEHGLRAFSEVTQKTWLAGTSLPDTNFILLLCNFFKCDANYLFGTDSFSYAAGTNQPHSQVEQYIYDEYGIDRKSLDFLRQYKDCGIDSKDDSDTPHIAKKKTENFSHLFNELLHNSPWAIANLLQIINANELSLSDHGFSEISIEDTYTNFPGIDSQLTKGNDIDVSLVILSIRLKHLIKNKNYIPNKSNLLETYDSELLKDGAVDDYISHLLANRLKNLNTEIETLSSYITKEPI